MATRYKALGGVYNETQKDRAVKELERTGNIVKTENVLEYKNHKLIEGYRVLYKKIEVKKGK
jgi:hypothetical protein